MDCRWLDTAFRPRARGLAPRRSRLAGLALALWLISAGLLTAFEDQTTTRLPVDTGKLYAASAVDVDGDHDLDLVLATQTGLRLLLNNGVGVFTDVTAARLPTLTGAFLAVVAGDVDHDGDLDLFAACADGASRLLLNQGSGSFTDSSATHLPTAASIATGAVLVDVDGDGDLDLVIASRDSSNRLLLNNGLGVFTAAAANRLPGDVGATSGVVAADLNGDRQPDLVFTSEEGPPRLLINDGAGVFTDSTATSLPTGLPGALGLAAADLDGDGNLDLVLAGGNAGLGLLRNDGSGHFVSVAPTATPLPPHYAIAVAVADLNEDGLPDVVVACAGQDRLLLNTGGGLLTDATATTLPVDTGRTFGVLAADLDGDLDLDLVLARPDLQTRLLLNPIAFPRLRLTAQPSLVEVGQTVTIQVKAFDEDGIAPGFPTLTVNGIATPLVVGLATYVPTAPGPYVAAAIAQDTTGASGGGSVSFVAVSNIAPRVFAGADATLASGHTLSRAGSFTDLSSGDAWSATVDYGDGTGLQPLALTAEKTFALSHVYNALGDYVLTVTVTDSRDAAGSANVGVTVTSEPPVVRTIPEQRVRNGTLFAHIWLDPYVDDPDNPDAQITWRASGQQQLTVTIDAERVLNVTYPPGGQLSEDVTLTATDPAGKSGSVTVRYVVTEANGDYLRPLVALRAVPETVDVGTTVTLHLTVTDDSAFSPPILTVQGAELPLLGAVGVYTATYTSAVPGVFTAVATATDVAGNRGDASTEFHCLVPGDNTAPFAAITTPAEDAKLSGATEVRGTATDANFLRYVLEYAAVGESTYLPFASANLPVSDGVLGVLDSTALRNGFYTIRLTVEDQGGNVTTARLPVTVVGEQKIGLCRLSFTDLTIPSPGVNITLVRSYSNQNPQRGDFGVGWTLGLQELTIEKSGVLGEDWFLAESGGFINQFQVLETRAHYVAVRFPNDSLEIFRMQVDPDHNPAWPYWTPQASFVPEGRATSTLEALGDNSLGWAETGGDISLYDPAFANVYDPMRFRLTTIAGYTYIISAETGVESITDANHNTLTIDRNEVKHSSGRRVSLARDELGRITRITYPDGNDPDGNNVLGYQYDAYGDLVAFTDQAGRVTRYLYNATHDLIEIIGPSGRAVRNEYDASGRLIASADPNGDRMEYEYDATGQTMAVSDALRRQTTYRYDERGHITSLTNPLGQTLTYTYDAQGNRLSETDPNGHTTSYTYDAQGNMLSVSLPTGGTYTGTYLAAGLPATSTDPFGNTTSVTYDGVGNMASVTDALGNTRSWTYDAQGNPTTFRDPLGNTTRFEYNPFGDLTKVTDVLGHSVDLAYDANGNQTAVTTTRTRADGTQEILVSTREYDPLNRVVAATDREGNYYAYSYTEGGQIRSTVGPTGEVLCTFDYGQGQNVTGTFPGGVTFASKLSPLGQPEYRLNAAGGKTSFTYDAAGQLLSIQTPDGARAQAVYDPTGNRSSVTNPAGAEYRFTYSEANELASTRDPLGNRVQYGYDEALRLTQITDPMGSEFKRTLDPLGRVTRSLFPDGTDQRMTYDAGGRLTSQTDQAGRITRCEYDAVGRLTRMTDPLSGVTTYAYDETGNLVAVTDARDKTTRMAYSSSGRRTRYTLPDGTSRQWTYDANGKLTTFTDYAGRTRTYTYGPDGRLAAVTYADGSQETYTYTALAKVASFTDVNGTCTYQYDARGRLTREVLPSGQAVDYQYGIDGALLAVTSAGGATRYACDDAGRLTTVTAPDGGVTSYTYNAAGSVTHIDYPNGVYGTAQYDSMQRLTRLQYQRADNTLLSSYQYSRDAVGKVTRITEADGRQVDYQYDALDRLTRETITPAAGPVQTVSYTYDAVGNRLTRTDAAGTLTYAYDDNYRLLTDGLRTYSYDANGNLTASADGADNHSAFTYNEGNRLVRAEITRAGHTDTIEHRYSRDRRLRTTVNGTEVTLYVPDVSGGVPRVLLETDAAGTPLAQYVYGHQPISRSAGGNTAYLHPDAGLSVRQLTNAAGQVTDSYTFDAFGQPLTAAGANDNPCRYAGGRVQPESGLYEFGRRWYDPQSGRFLSRDPLPGKPEQPASYNPYAYAANSPTNLVDPSGLEFTLPSLSTTCAIIGTLAAVNFLAIVTDLHPFAIGSQFDGINDNGRTDGHNLVEPEFAGDWVQMSSSMSASVGGRTIGSQMVVSMALGTSRKVAVRHEVFAFGVNMRKMGEFDDAFTAMMSMSDFMNATMLLAGGDASPPTGFWSADALNLEMWIGFLSSFALQSQLYDFNTDVGLSVGLGLARVWGATDSGKLDGLSLGGSIGGSFSGGALSAGGEVSLSFGMNTDRASVLSGNFWNGSTALGFAASAGVSIPSTTSVGPPVDWSLNFIMSLAFRSDRFSRQ